MISEAQIFIALVVAFITVILAFGLGKALY
uniref:Photosystem I reaction center subunit XII n=1 Tax=Pherosphaera fitzgeraldii TaxID=56896 RepID=A0A3Q9WTT3_9CONI|nr:photosystem I protein M [Pherosphaera fitzgeraldii]BBF90996.1 photosystem I subunit XII [Pherosphaera fitzgeraldii]